MLHDALHILAFAGWGAFGYWRGHRRVLRVITAEFSRSTDPNLAAFGRMLRRVKWWRI